MKYFIQIILLIISAPSFLYAQDPLRINSFCTGENICSKTALSECHEKIINQFAFDPKYESVFNFLCLMKKNCVNGYKKSCTVNFNYLLMQTCKPFSLSCIYGGKINFTKQFSEDLLDQLAEDSCFSGDTYSCFYIYRSDSDLKISYLFNFHKECISKKTESCLLLMFYYKDNDDNYMENWYKDWICHYNLYSFCL